jgi:hypothetical protein
MSQFLITAVTADQGKVAVNADGTLSYTLPAEFIGDTITCSIEARIVIDAVSADRPPVAAPDAGEVMAGGSVTIDVLANDEDPEGGPLSVVEASADIGRVTIAPDSLLVYSAPKEFTGTATIDYVVADEAESLSQGQATITVTSYAAPDLAPIIGDDAVTMVAGGTVAIDVLANDTDPEGKALAITAATVDNGSVAVTPDGKLAYTAPAGVTGTAAIRYTAADPAGNTSEGRVVVDILRLSIAKGELEGEFVVNTAPGELTITVAAPAEYAGDYTVRTADLADGPVNLVPPQISGSPRAGATLEALPGLWAIDETTTSFDVARQWMRDATPISGATGASYVVDGASDAGCALSVVETAAADVETASEAVRIPETTPATSWTPKDLPGLAAWFDASDAGSAKLSGGSVVELSDKSGSDRHARPVSGKPAPALTGDLNGKPVLRFPEQGTLRTQSAPQPGLPGMPGLAVIAVTQAHQKDAWRKCVTFGATNASGGEYLKFQTGYSVMWFGNGNRYWNHSPAGPAIEAAVYREKGTHGDAEVWRNGRKLAPTSTSRSGNAVVLAADAVLELGSDDSPTSEQAEILLVVGPLSEADRARAEGYLAHKWGLAGELPADHPHKAAPPA